MAFDRQYWTVLASKLSPSSLYAIHGGLTNVATHDRAEFDAYSDFRDQTNILEAELASRNLSFTPIP